jgi:DNA-binding NarL/FixJ family response regulator
MQEKQQPAGRQKTKVFIVDDHPLVRERLAEVINHERDLTVCGEAEDRHHALQGIQATKPDLAIVDLALKDSHGLDLIKDLEVHCPNVLVLVLSMHEESLYAERVIRAGARGFITKQQASQNILQAIRRVLAGEVYLSDQMAGQIVSKIAGHPRPGGLPIDMLSDRELQVLELIGAGYATDQIAEQLHLDVRTIETYRARIKEKLNLPDAAGLLQTAIQWVQSGRAG